MTPKNVLSDRNNAIDLLRAFCILYIVGYWHLFDYTSAFPDYKNYFTESLTKIVLGTFTFISGFLLSQKSLTLSVNDILQFYKRRLIRIYPLYFIALILFVLARFANIIDFAKAAVMISMFYPPAMVTLWFITMIMFFYIITPFLIHFADNRLNFTIFFCVIMTAFLIFNSFINSLDIRIIMYFPTFAFGVFLNRQQNINIKTYLEKKKYLLLASIIPFFLLSLFKTNSSFIDALLSIPIILSGSLTLFVYANRYAAQISFNSFVYFLSYSSFCIYLFHRLIFLVTKKLFFPSHGEGQIIYLLFVSLPSIIVISWLIQKIYDTGLRWLTK